MSRKRVLLVTPPHDLGRVMGHTGKLLARWEPLGLLYIAAVLLENGYDVQVIDAEGDPHTLDDMLRAVEAYDPAIIGITCLTPTAATSVELGCRLREAHRCRTVVMGNVHAWVFAETLLRLGACDFVVQGEGEFTLLELLRCLEAGGDPASVGGVSFLQGEDFVKTPPRPLPRDLDVIPPPARHLVKHIDYDAGLISNMSYMRPKGTVSRHAMGARGCVFECKFCVVHQERRFRTHSPKRIVDEMIDLQENYNCGFIFFIDSIFEANKGRAHAICDEIRRRGVKVPWGCEGHVRMVDRETLHVMRAAGCVNIAYGIESGSQRVLDRIGKGTKLEDVDEAIRLTHAVGISTSGLFILGLPGETRDQMERTIELAAKLPLDLAQFTLFVPFPGSRYFEELSAAGIIDTGVRPDGSVDFDVWRRYSSYVGYGQQGGSIYLPPGFTFDELFAMQRKALRRFYLRPHQILRNLKRIRPGNVIDATRAAGTLFFKRSIGTRKPAVRSSAQPILRYTTSPRAQTV
ncbi:MAG: radical SAM protein [Phycisphaerae bacterium]